jgi:V8-like Glu-specific endopeptidase
MRPLQCFCSIVLLFGILFLSDLAGAQDSEPVQPQESRLISSERKGLGRDGLDEVESKSASEHSNQVRSLAPPIDLEEQVDFLRSGQAKQFDSDWSAGLSKELLDYLGDNRSESASEQWSLFANGQRLGARKAVDELIDPLSENLDTKAIIGLDDRREVSQLSFWSEMRTGQVLIGLDSICSGTLISERHVLTSGHCVVDPLNGRIRDESIYFAPGRTARQDPIGYYYARRVFIPAPYQRFVAQDAGELASPLEQILDLAVIELEQAIASDKIGSSDFGVGAEQQTLSTTGYPGDKPMFSRWRTACESHSPEEYVGFMYVNQCDSMGGQSGSGMIGEDVFGNEDVLVAVLSGGSAEISMQTRLKPGNILLWRGFKSSESFDFLSAGNLDFISSWLHWDDLADAFGENLSPGQRRELASIVQRLSVTKSYVNPVRVNKIQLINECAETIEHLAFGVRRQNGEFADGFYNLRPKEQFLFYTESRQDYLFWARTVFREWSGDQRRSLHGHELSMIRVPLQGPRFDFASPFGRHLEPIGCD